jgi:phosphoserine phosphatase RsbU/P
MEARTRTSAKDLLCAVNEAMRINLDNKSFVTALCLVINENGTAMSYARAGHPFLLKLGEPGDVPVNIPCNGVALGLVSDPQMFASLSEEVSISLVKGDRYLLYTDGLTEANNPARETYGMPRLADLLSQERSRNPDKIIASIMNDVKKFSLDTPYHDDLTMLAIEIT